MVIHSNFPGSSSSSNHQFFKPNDTGGNGITKKGRWATRTTARSVRRRGERTPDQSISCGDTMRERSVTGELTLMRSRDNSGMSRAPERIPHKSIVSRNSVPLRRMHREEVTDNWHPNWVVVSGCTTSNLTLAAPG